MGDPVTYGANINTPGKAKKVGKGGIEYQQSSNVEFHVNNAEMLETEQRNGRFAVSADLITVHKQQHVAIYNGMELFAAYNRLLNSYL